MNYRYLADEIVYVLDNADAEVLVVHGAMADRVAAAAARLPKLRLQYLVLAHAVGRHGESEKVLGKALVPYEGEFAERKRRVRYGMAHAKATKPYRSE